MRKWIWASTVLTVAVACGFYGVASWANQHPLSVLNYGARIASVVGVGHTHVARPCPAPNQDEEGPCAIVQELPDASPTHEIDEPIVVENTQPLPPENVEPPASDPSALPPSVEETEPPVLVMPPCPEDVEPSDLTLPCKETIILTQSVPDDLTTFSQVPNQSGTVLPASGNGTVPDCQIDPNYHHLYPGCPWMGGCQNIPAYVPVMPAERTRSRPAKIKWLTVQTLLERLGLSGIEQCEEPDQANDDGDPSNLTDIIF